MVVDPGTLTDLERSARFLYLQRMAFGGKVAGRNFGVAKASPGAFDVTKLGSLLEAIHDRLAGVTIECLTWSDFVDRYDTPETLFYLDPPYWGSEDDYGAGVFRPSDFTKLAARLSAIKGRFILSVNDVPATRAVFGEFLIEAVSTRYTVAGSGGSEVGEILVYGPGNDPSLMPTPRDLLSI
jgi:DNA adenine methylase